MCSAAVAGNRGVRSTAARSSPQSRTSTRHVASTRTGAASYALTKIVISANRLSLRSYPLPRLLVVRWREPCRRRTALGRDAKRRQACPARQAPTQGRPRPGRSTSDLPGGVGLGRGRLGPGERRQSSRSDWAVSHLRNTHGCSPTFPVRQRLKRPAVGGEGVVSSRAWFPLRRSLQSLESLCSAYQRLKSQRPGKSSVAEGNLRERAGHSGRGWHVATEATDRWGI